MSFVYVYELLRFVLEGDFYSIIILGLDKLLDIELEKEDFFKVSGCRHYHLGIDQTNHHRGNEGFTLI